MRAGGFEVVGTARAWEGSRSALAELLALAQTTQLGGGLRPSTFKPLYLDVSSAGSRLEFPAALAEVLRNSKLNALVNNAGVFPQPPGAWDASTLKSVLETNALGPLRLAEDLRQQCAAADFHAVNVTSGLGKLAALREPYRARLAACCSVKDLAALPFVEDYAAAGATSSASAPAYSISKAALNRGTRLLAEAWQRSEHRISAVDPGWCSTAMGGPTAPRSPRDGALSILSIVLGNPDTVGSGNVFSSKGLKEE